MSFANRFRLLCSCAALGVAVTLALPAASQAEFGLSQFDLLFQNGGGTIATEAGSHPGAVTNILEFKTTVDPQFGEVPDQMFRSIEVNLPAGLVGAPGATPRCTGAQFIDIFALENRGCDKGTIVGKIELEGSIPREKLGIGDKLAHPVFNLVPPPGIPQRLGFVVLGVPIVIDFRLNSEPPYNVIASVRNTPQSVVINRSVLTVFGTPGGHAFLTLPRSCNGPLTTTYAVDSWQNSGDWLPDGKPDLSDAAWVQGSALTHDEGEPPVPQGMTGCGALNFSPTVAAKPTARAAQSPTGLDFSLNVQDEGLTSADGLAQADIAKTVVTLPEGMTVNPSIAEGLEVCSEAELDKETAFSDPGQGCPEAAKIGTVEVETPLLDERVSGALYQATPYENPFGSLIALYMVIKNPKLGIIIKQPLKVESDPSTGRITTIADDLPELPFSSFKLHFREGARSPLVTPPTCGTHTVEAALYPSTGGSPVKSNSSFEIVSGPGAGPCPAGGLPPFRPSLLAGTQNNAAGAFSPFLVRLSRTDSEQEFTNFSIKLPPGVAGKLAGIATCSDLGIALAVSRTGPHGGQEELDSPSCPAASQVGTTLAGAGVGSALAYAPGKIYLAGPYHGRPLSMVAITSGVVGPFDIGTVVVRLAIDVNPETGEVFLDSTGSDPIPHIINGIPVHLREIRAFTDRAQFTYNPTSCEPTSTSATVLGSGLDFASSADDNPFVSTSRFQAADCAALSFRPKLSFKLKGSTKRGGNPSLRAHVAMKGFGEAAIRYAQVTLPKSEFLDQSHIGTVCTRVQFNAGTFPGEQCPPASVYGKVEARTPILDAPLAGPIFLRSNGGERELPDLVAALHGSQIDVSLVGYVDSGKNGGIRNTFAFVPDAPVSSADFTFFGGKKGLLDNSRNLCRTTNKVQISLKAHSGKRVSYKTPLKPLGCKGKKGKRSARQRP